MTTIETFPISYDIRKVIILQFGSIGGVIGVLVISILLLHVIYHYFKTFHQSKKKKIQKRKATYYLTMIYFISGIMTCSIYAFFRSNLFTQIPLHSFSKIQCEMGYFGGLLLVSINKILFFVIITKWIKISFKDSVYGYEPILFIFIYWALSIFITIGWILLIISQNGAYWELIIYDGSININMIYCNRSRDTLSIELMTSHCILALGEIAMLFGLTYLFLRGLWKLHASISELDEEDDYENNNNESINIQQHERLDRLMNVIKKQSILVCFAAGSTIILWSFAMYTFDVTTWICWDILIHCICIWLMFGFAKIYWNWCSKYGICYCCYYKKKKNRNDNININV